MPKKGQKSVTLPEWVVELARQEFERHRERYMRLNITSPTKLIALWIVEHTRG